MRAADRLLQRRPRAVALGFVAVTAVLAAAGMSRLTVDQKVNEELAAYYPALQAEATYENEMAGFLGPELSVVPRGGDVRALSGELVAFVNRLCDMPEVRLDAAGAGDDVLVSPPESAQPMIYPNPYGNPRTASILPLMALAIRELFLARRLGSDARVTLRSMFDDVLVRHPERPALSYPIPMGTRGRVPNLPRWARSSKAGPPPTRIATRVDKRGRTICDWRTLTWHEVGRLIVDVADRLPLTVGAGGTVAVLADTDARYPLLELAVGLAGRTVQPLYVSATDDELRTALRITGADVLVVGRSQSARAHAGRLHAHIVELDGVVALPGVGGAPHAALPADVEPFDSRRVRAHLERLSPRADRTPLLYLQSTGTTGPARVIDIGEAGLVSAVRAVAREASHQFPRFLSFLPTAHISERLLTLYASLALAGHTFHGGGLSTLADDLRACRPTVLLAPPLLLEALRDEAIAGAGAGALGRRLLASVEVTADALLASGVTNGVRRPLGARLFGRLLRRSAGLDQVRDAVAGTAPLPARLHAWYEAAGIPLRDVYGQTELTGATSIAPGRGASFGAVGVPVAGVAIRIAPDGELLVRADSMFRRYVGDQAATARVLRDGWLHTGDRARRLASGEIVITGRVQSLVMASDGTPVDTAEIAARLRGVFGSGTAVFAPAGDDGGVHLFLAFARSTRPPAALALLAGDDARWSQVAAIIDDADPRGVVRGWALYDGAFEQATGEVGPTGKPRGWRIQELRAGDLCARTSAGEARPSRGLTWADGRS